MAEVTLAIPVFNSGAFLDDLFACILQLDPPPREVVFLDDASRDDSLARVQRFAASGACKAPVRALSNERNLGIAGTYNRLVGEARSEWVQLLDADDLIVERDFYRRAGTDLDGGNGLVVAALQSNARLLHIGADIVSRFVPRRLPRWLPVLGTVATRAGVLYRREAAAALPFPDPAYPGSDVVHLLRLRQTQRCAFVRRAHVCYRIHAAAQSAQARDYSLYRDALARFDLPTRLAHRFDLWLRQLAQRIVR